MLHIFISVLNIRFLMVHIFLSLLNIKFLMLHIFFSVLNIGFLIVLIFFSHLNPSHLVLTLLICSAGVVFLANTGYAKKSERYYFSLYPSLQQLSTA